MNRKISVNTVQELIDHRHTVTIYCHNPRCHHRAELDLVKVREKLGPDKASTSAVARCLVEICPRRLNDL